MFSMQVYKWNSVDINGENGIHCTRGIVVDKTETGLLVDFGIANKGPQLIAFNRIIHDEEPASPLPCTCRSGSSTNHEVLLQLSVEQPWTWYPAEKLPGSSGSFALVKATVSDGRCITDVVRKMHVRCGNCAKRRRAVLFGDYLKEPVDVSCDALVVTSSFRQLWTRKNYLARTYPVGIVDGVHKRLYYMQRRHDKGLDPSLVVRHIEDIMGKSTTRNRGLKRSHADLEKEITLHHHLHMERELTISDVPCNVLHIVLSHLDTIELFRYRRVCSLWDAVITSMDCSKVVICDMSAYGKKRTYAFATLLLRVIKETTKYLIFTRQANELTERCGRDWFRKTMELTKVILDQTGFTVPTLVLADLEIDNSDFFGLSYSSKAVSKKLRSICQRLVLVRVTLLNLFEDKECVLLIDKFAPARNLEIPFANIRTDNITQFELRDALEPSAQQFMKSVDKCEIERLNNWISQANEVNDAVGIGISDVLNYIDQQKIMQVLRIWEADDCRFGPACTWKDVESAQLSNNLDKLHSITVKCMLYKMDARFKEDYSDSDEEEDAEDSDEEEDEEEESADDDENSDDDEEED